MNIIIKKLTAAAASAAIAVCSAGYNSCFGADTTEDTKYKVHFEIGDDVTIVPDDDGNVAVFEDVEKTYNSTVFIPVADLEREGYYFTGWTADDVYGYVGGRIFRVPDHDVNIRPVWNKKGDKVNHTVTLSVVIDGEERTDYEKMFSPQKGPSGTLVEIPMNVFPREGYTQRGWTDGTHLFAGQQYIIINDEDITLEPNWCKKYKLTYTVGDADRINGAVKQEYEVMETGDVNLQSSDRFSRNGFTIKGWHCETDGKDYSCDQKFTMPSNDVVMTPIWNPINYTVVFFAETGSGSDDIRIKGKTDTTITVPECAAAKEGYTFGGWKIEDKIYQPGDEFLIVGAKPGIGISFKAVWNEAGSETTTTTTSATTTTTTTTAASSATTTVTSTTVSSTASSSSSTTSSATATSASTTSSQTTSSSGTTTATSTTLPAEKDLGDANCDGSIDMADVVLIMQALANPNKFDINGTDDNHITEKGRTNADVWNTGDGLTTEDALHIQKYLLGLCEITGKAETASVTK